MKSSSDISASNPDHPEPIRESRFQRRRKAVEKAIRFRDVGNLLLIPGVADDFYRLVGRLGTGEGPLRRHYRARLDDPEAPDELLDQHGIKHLHLVRQNSNYILYCIEYRNLILLLQISGHVPLDSKPPGADLLEHFEVELTNLKTYQKVGQMIRQIGVALGIPRKK